jgi:AraC-like DNA-binding protein
MVYFDKIISLARKNKVKLHFFITPYHARHLELIDQAGLWDQFEDWKRELVALLQKDNEGRAVNQRFELYDFTTYTKFNTTSVPMKGDSRSTMKWYWNATHYKKELGDLILERMFSNKSVKDENGEDFGIKLVPENLQYTFVKQRRGKILYRASHVQDITDITSIGIETSSKRPVIPVEKQMIDLTMEVLKGAESVPDDINEQVGFESMESFEASLYKASGFSANEYITIMKGGSLESEKQKKLSSAKRLLTATHFNMARVSSLSGFQSLKEFNQTFKHDTGVVPLRYRHNNGGDELRETPRLEIAKNLLETTELNIESVVEGSGFGDINIMRRRFKENTGLLPVEYRERSKLSENN